MSTLSRVATAEPVSRVASAQPRSMPAVVRWAWLGAMLLAVEYLLIGKWVFGDKFERVPSGPDTPPQWMEVVLVTGQVVAVIGTLWTFYWFLVRPWRSERRLTTDGILVLAFLLVSPFDPVSNSGTPWFTYNAYLLNMGSVVGDIPGNFLPNVAGANEAWPLLIIPTCYAGLFIWVSIVLCAIMRAAKRRWPRISPLGLLAVCFSVGVILDILIEGIIYEPLGFWVFGGGHLNINAGTYYQFPMQEGVFAGIIFTTFSALRFFTDDKGRTLVERGIDKVRGKASRKNLVRFLAITGFVHACFWATYHVPQYWLGMHATQWPKDIVERSYFTNRLCGPEVNLACPGPMTPIARPDSPRMTYDGRLVQP